jgi:glycosyltransferase involved in cell wall biosynthesis
MTAGAPRRVLRVIARLNVGGPARHAVILDAGLRDRNFETLLLHGTVRDGEASFDHLAERQGLRTVRISSLGRRIRLLDDVRAFTGIWRALREFQPDVVHTHTAKAGALGRLAAALHNVFLPSERKAVVVHTFHGHVLQGYFGPIGTCVVRLAERLLGSMTDCTIAISELQRRDLVDTFGVAQPVRTVVVPLGLELAALLAMTSEDRARARAAAGYDKEFVVGFVGRLVPIKHTTMLIDAVKTVRHELPRVRLIITGDGPERNRLEARARDAGVADITTFNGWREDLAAVYAPLDLLMLTSRNEGTPVALIEAMAAGVPVAATAVGGVPDVIQDGVTGLLADESVRSVANCILETARAPHAAAERAVRAREFASATFSESSLLDRMSNLYERLLRQKRPSSGGGRNQLHKSA